MPMPRTAQYSTFIDVLQYRASGASGCADQTVFTYLEDGERQGGTLSFAQLDRRARGVAAQLQRRAQPGARVLLVYPPGLDYIAAFFGCLYAGMIAVPALPPANARTRPRLALIARDAQPSVALTLAAIASQIAAHPVLAADELSTLEWCASDQLDDLSAHWTAPAVGSDAIALLQYTSGSTGEPKGVKVSHGNMLANVGLIDDAFAIVPGQTIVSWLPPHHDMGLIGKMMYPVYAGCHCVQFAPAAFLMRPHRWLKAISDYRARLTAAPNFAYELCVSQIPPPQRAGLDLSCLEFALNGAEPVRPATLRRFAQAYAGCGLRAEALTPAYGLAESTLQVAIRPDRQADGLPAMLLADAAAYRDGRVAAASADGLELVAAGAPGAGHEVLIVDPASLQALPEDRVGEIWVRGPSVAHGYWNRPEQTEQAFGGRLAGATARYLRTGDLGFLHGRQLYVSGRSKDMMIFNGRNVYPQDVEATVARADPAFRADACAAFAVDTADGPQLVLVQEVVSRSEAAVAGLMGRLRAELDEQHGVAAIAAVLLVKAGRLPRTSSGKIQRQRCRQLFLADQFAPLWSWRAGQDSAAEDAAATAEPATDTERRLAARWQAVLGGAPVGAGDNFFMLPGGHSLSATQLVSSLREEFGVELPLRTVYDAPTLAGLARAIEAARGAQAGRKPAGIARAPAGGAAPASFAQQRLWFLDQMQPGDPFYNIPAAIELDGPLDAGALGASLQAIVRRHAALRTRFVLRDEALLQDVAPELALAMPLTDLAALAPAARAQALAGLMREAAGLPFALNSWPLLRAGLVRLEPQRHVLLLTLHHIVADGWSMGVLVRELTALYQAGLQRRDAALPALPIAYTDFSQWQHQWLQGEVLAQQLGYWRQALAGELPVLNLTLDRPRPAVQSMRGASHSFAIAPAQVAALRALGQREGATLFMVALAAFNVLLHRYTGQTDIVVGTPIANRNQVEIEQLVGFFVNTLVLRSDLSGDPAFSDFLRRVRETALGAYTHQDLPFERLVEELQPEREANYTPLFRVMFALQAEPLEGLSLPGLALRDLHARSGTAKFDLTLFLWEGAHGLRGELEYSTDLFDAATMARMAAHFQCLLAGLLAQPRARLSALPLLLPAERRQLLVDWNATATAYPAGACIAELVEQQVRLRPQARALDDGAQVLSYAECNARANRLAHHLRSLGVRQETRVAVCLERGCDLVIALLAIVKAGGAYVPLDPSYPAERLGFMLADAGVTLLVTAQAWRDLPALARVPSVLVDADRAAIAARPDGNPGVPGHPDQLAYITYTSGSTGVPKGVAVPHRGVLRLVKDTAYLRLTAGEVLLQAAPVSFDASTFEVWGALANGAALVISAADKPALAELAARIEGGRVDTLFLTSALFHLLVEENPPGLAGMRQLLAGGEALSAAAVRKARKQWPQCEVGNVYGPTETTTFACTYPAAQLDEASLSVPIGRPIANTTMYVLDPGGNPVPVGVAGELYIGGPGVARGYLNRPDLTADRFLPDPFGAAGGRLYRTGDLVRYLPDGNIDFLGRLDQQVKLRGFRIELGEIETVLRGHPAVEQALALVREDRPGERKLTAYLVPRLDYRARQDQLRELEARQIEQWQLLYEESVYLPGAEAETAFNLAGWNSSYTGQPIPPEEMREWVEHTVARIAALAPQRVWEIGCGTGLLLFRVAPGASQYYGTDFARQALAFVASRLEEQGLPQVRLAQRLADDFSEVAPGAFDLVILNSIVQYFPDIDYLLRVLDGAVEAVGAGGRIFLGDLRNFALLPEFHASVLAFQSDPATPAGLLQQKVRKQIELENELAVAPAFFTALRRRHPQIGQVEILHKRGAARNELSCYRYDVILHIGPAARPQRQADWLDWQQQGLDPAALAALLRRDQPDLLALARIPNARVRHDALLAGALAQGAAERTLAQLREDLTAAAPAVDPEALARLAEQLGYQAQLRWSGPQHETCFDLVLARDAGHWPQQRHPAPALAPWQAYANHPLAAMATAQLVPQLRSYLQHKLPDYAQPAALVLLDALPLNLNGKVDLRRLPAPAAGRALLERQYVAPASAVEQALAAIWMQLLRLEQIGVHDNFFELGGDSIIAIQVVSRARGAGLALHPRDLFEAQTIAALAARVRQGGAEADAAQCHDQPFALAPIQRWFFEQRLTRHAHWNQWVMLGLNGAPDRAAFEAACTSVLQAHDSLRLRFAPLGGWRQRYGAGQPASVEFAVLADGDAAGQQAALAALGLRLQESLDLEQGPLVRFCLVELGPRQPPRCLIVAHHLVIDGVSWRILLDDLEQAYRDALAHRPSSLPQAPGRYQQWCAALAGARQSRAIERDIGHWRALAQGGRGRLEQVVRGTPNRYGTAQSLQLGLDARETADLLGHAALARLGGLQTLLAAAVLHAVGRCSGQDALMVTLERHGRQLDGVALDLSRTIGWFTAKFPVLLDGGQGADAAALLRRTHETLAAVPNGGLSYGILRYLGGDGVLGPDCQPDVSVNYLGQFDQVLGAAGLFRADAVELGLSCAPAAPRAHLLDVDAFIIAGQLRLRWTYDGAALAPAAVRRLAETALGFARQAGAALAGAPAGVAAAAPARDQLGLSSEQFDDLLDELDAELE